MFKRIFSFLLIATAFCLAANSNSNSRPAFFAKDSVKAEQHAALTQVDFDEYYINLIESEKSIVRNATTMSIISGAVTGFGIFTTVIAFKNSKHKNDWAEVHRQTLQIAGIGLTVAGVFGLSYNLYTIIKGTGENSKRASYERAYDIYKRKRTERKNGNDGAKIILTPTIDLLGTAAGVNLNILF